MGNELNVLIADDDGSFRQLVNRFVTKFFYKVFIEEVSDGRSLRNVDYSRFDLIISDLQMPECNGDDAIRALRAEGYAGPVILWSSNPSLINSEGLGDNTYTLDKGKIPEFRNVLGSLELIANGCSEG